MIPRLVVLPGVLLVAAMAAGAGEPLELAQSQFDAGNYTQAVQTLEAALARAPADARLDYWLARSYYELKDYDRAITYAERAVKFEPNSSDYHHWLGRAYGEKADRDRSFWLARKVRAELETAVRLNPRNISARRDLMQFHLEAPWILGGDKSKARQEAEAIAALDPLEGRLARATYWRADKKVERAEAEYRQVLASGSQRVEPYLEVADYYMERQNAAGTEAAVEAAARAHPSDQRLAYFRGVARVLAGNRLPEAEQLLKTYLTTVPPRSEFPSQASARVWLGRVYEALGKRQEAAGEYRAALRLDPNRKAAREGLRRVDKRL